MNDAIPAIQALPRLFLVEFNNAKKKHPNRPLEEYVAEGVRFSSGRVIIDTDALKAGYASMEDLEKTLSYWGRYAIHWLDEREG